MYNINKIKGLGIALGLMLGFLVPVSQAYAGGGFSISYGYSQKDYHKSKHKKHHKKHYKKQKRRHRDRHYRGRYYRTGNGSSFYYGYGNWYNSHDKHKKHKKHMKHKPHRKHIRKHLRHSSRRYHNHDHDYNVHGYIQYLPFGARKIVYKGRNYFEYHGKYYRKCKFGYDLVHAPIGLCIGRLPYGYKSVHVYGDHYYVKGNTYYKKGSDGYVVVHEPEYEVTYYEDYNDSFLW